jgi:hypothetical protein
MAMIAMTTSISTKVNALPRPKPGQSGSESEVKCPGDADVERACADTDLSVAYVVIALAATG